jgi:hypothetical protein
LISHLLQVLWRNRDGGEAALKNNRLTYFLIFFGLLATEIVIALFVNDAFVRPYVGDMLVTLLLCCLCHVIVPNNVRLLPVYVFIFAAAVEIGQYFDLVALLDLENNRILSIALGRTFSWLDIGCYAGGCAAAFLVDQIIIRRSKM